MNEFKERTTNKQTDGRMDGWTDGWIINEYDIVCEK